MFGLAGSRRWREEVGEYVRGSLWVLPGIAVLAALIAGSVLSLVDVPRDGLLYKLVFQGTPDDARTLLIGTAGTMISVVALVLGLTVVALQVASSQYSPRLLGNFLRDRHNQVVLSVFVATFAYSTAGLYIERTLLQDAAFGMRQLVDIALKALSPGTNDPYTAVMSVERLTALLAALAPRRLGDIVLHDPDGTSRVVARFPTFADYVDLAIGQIRRYGAREPQVVYALLRLLRVVGALTRDSHRRQVLASHARLVLADAERTICQPADLAPLQSEGETLLQTLAG
jgi:uncharacterized membrane protein